MSLFMIWIAILLFGIGFFVVMVSDASRHLWVTSLGWLITIIAFVIACMF